MWPGSCKIPVRVWLGSCIDSYKGVARELYRQLAIRVWLGSCIDTCKGGAALNKMSSLLFSVMAERSVFKGLVSSSSNSEENRSIMSSKYLVGGDMVKRGRRGEERG